MTSNPSFISRAGATARQTALFSQHGDSHRLRKTNLGEIDLDHIDVAFVDEAKGTGGSALLLVAAIQVLTAEVSLR